MTAAEADAGRLLALPEDEFFSLDAPARAALQTALVKALAAKPFSKPPGAAAVAPSELRVVSLPPTLDWQRRNSLPMLLAERRSGLRAWAVHPGQNRLFLLSNLNTGAVDVRAPLDEGRRMPILAASGSETPPSALNASAALIGVLQFDLLRWFTRDQAQGRFAVTVIEFDQASNTSIASGSSAPSAEAASRRRVQRLKAEALPLSARQAPGVRMTLAGSVDAAAPAQMQAELSLPRSLTTSVAMPGERGGALVVAASLMFVQLDNLMPELLHLTLPARVAVPADNDGERVEAAFRIELRAALAGRKMSGLYQAYLIVGSTVTGPQPVTFALP